MRAAPFLIVALAAPAAAGAQSTDGTRTMAVSASAPEVCAVQGPQLAGGAQVNFRGLNGSALQIERLVDPTTLSTNAASIEVSLEAVCNYPHRLTVETQNNGLWQTVERAGPAVPGFASAIPYTATVRWGRENMELQADAKSRRIAERSIAMGEATSGSIVLRLEIQPGASNDRQNAPLLAGFYGDTLRVTVEPQ
jgi:hypothetical protein